MIAIEGPAPSPPILFVDENGEAGPLFVSLEELANYLEWPEQYDEPAGAYDSDGRQIQLAVSERGAVTATVANETTPAKVATLLRAIIGDRPMRFGLLDADLPLDGLLRALWKFEHRKAIYPRDIGAR